MKKIEIIISSDFTDAPGARYRKDGPFSGEEFYEDLMKSKLKSVWDNEEKLYINFDNTMGYASSFISEVFLRAVTDFKDKKKIKEKIIFISEDDPLLIDEIEAAIDEAKI